jgi:hypothetical protein
VTVTARNPAVQRALEMVGVAKTKAQACIEVHDSHGMSKPLCTPFIGH